MTTSLRLKLGVVVCLVLLSVITILPSFYTATPSWWKKYMAPGGLHLGLDLQGGMHLVLKVDLERAAQNTLELVATDLKERLAEESISVVQSKSLEAGTVIFTLPNANAVEQVNALAKDDPDVDLRIETEAGSFPRIFITLSKEKNSYIRANAVNQSLEILRNRIDQFGVAEPVIIRQGDDEIVIQLPGVKDPKRALKLLGDTAQLEFKMVAEPEGLNIVKLVDEAVRSGKWHQGEGIKKLNQELENLLPKDTSVYFEKEIDPATKVETSRPLLLQNKIIMTGDMIKDAQVRIGGTFNEPYVSLDMTGSGSKVFGTVTEKNVGRRMAIVLDDIVRSAPVIREKILGGSAQISGSFTHEEATDLAIILRVGALPAPVDIIQNMTVGASLGQDSIQQGITSGILGSLLVIGFMLIYYRLSGVIANTAMVLNILFLFAGLAILSATLTMPGIAGIVLSIGMAVDSNVLIFERMREESALGKSIKSSIDGGFSKAFLTIVDAHVTTLITALALFLFGTGPVKGFAVTLSLGIIFNLFTSINYSHWVFNGLNSYKLIQRIHYMQFIQKPNLDYMKLRKFAFALSGSLVILGMVAFGEILLGNANMGVDFSGGSLLQYKSSHDFSMNEVRQVFDRSHLEGVDLQQVENEGRLMVKIKKSSKVIAAELSEQVTAVLNNQLPDKKFTLESQTEIGSSVSAVLRNKAMLAIALSMTGVIVYLGFRFNLSFGIGAAIATFHDVFAVLGICWIMNIEITLLMVTALLTLAGYSLNDTVVIFDRIRENMNKSETPSLLTVINDSVNQVLARSIVTSFTAFLSVLALFMLGGSVIHDFSFALLLGIIIGTYSSIFVASPILTLWDKN
ncbi:protein translocase subunit SecDF [Desulfopila aestuarii]|uniref:Multifunctional fusion protein n=1 Tax=Desulfopila aestuarii DSM 18488 TaxID=1121416 RepID=A0A1M7YI87_9BACT|nr:protein translocase subunit SecDF [Desulfopila aestuarii]SHO52313.1 protein translocase subunit secF/protein translocase subunit secD [Desulfopila aestuarii DSM 18488]